MEKMLRTEMNGTQLLAYEIEVDEKVWPSIIHYVQAKRGAWHENDMYDVLRIAVRAAVFQHAALATWLLRYSGEVSEVDAVFLKSEELRIITAVLHELRREVAKIAILQSESTVDNVLPDDLIERLKLIEELRVLPVHMFSKLRYLQPQVGCFNRCSFCSQSAGSMVWYLNERGLRNLFSALKTVALEKAQQYELPNGEAYIEGEMLNAQQTLHHDFTMPEAGLVSYGRTTHRPGVIFCYLDNDISTYPHLAQYIQYAYEDLGVRVRISTVGYSRKNEQLQRMHKLINKKHAKKIAGVRLSLTSYTASWAPNQTDNFKDDVANFLRVYRPTIDEAGLGQRTACVEFRFRPLIETRLPFHEAYVNGVHILHIGPYALYCEKQGTLQTATVTVDDKTLKLRIHGHGETYTLITSDTLRTLTEHTFVETIETLVQQHDYPRVTVYKMENEDGHYYVADPLMTNDGVFTKQFYPPTTKRKFAGYIDSERYFLNTLLAYKQQQGIAERRAPFLQSTWADVANTVNSLRDLAKQQHTYNAYAASYIEREIIPLVHMYAQALNEAAYAPHYFYASTFTIDTGSICNLGQAYFEFQDIASRPNLPLTPQHEKSYGANSSLSVEGEKWRISVTPHSRKKLRMKAVGKRNELQLTPSIIIERENLALRSLGAEQGVADYSETVTVKHIEQLTLAQGMAQSMLIGQWL